MGEMADMILQDMWDLPDWNDGWSDPDANLRCRYCGRRGFHWDQSEVDGRWRLHTSTGKVHSCKAYQEARKA